MKEKEEIERLCKKYGINLTDRKLPFNEKIRQLGNNWKLFYRYKRDQRLVLDFSLTKNPDVLKEKEKNYLKLRLQLMLQVMGPDALSLEELKFLLSTKKREDNQDLKDIIKRRTFGGDAFNKDSKDDILAKFIKTDDLRELDEGVEYPEVDEQVLPQTKTPI